MMTTSVPNLDYAPAREGAARRRWMRRLRRLLPLLALAILIWQTGPWLYRVARFRYLQHQCGTYEQGPKTVVCAEPPRWAGATPGFLMSASDPAPLAKLLAEYPESYGTSVRKGVVLFMHWRTSAAGKERLVIVRRVEPAMRESWDAPLAFSAIAVPCFQKPPISDPPPTRMLPQRLPETVQQVFGDDPSALALRFFAGQADPSDGSHFTIDYDVQGQPGTLDGYLRDDDAGEVTVELKTR